MALISRTSNPSLSDPGASSHWPSLRKQKTASFVWRIYVTFVGACVIGFSKVPTFDFDRLGRAQRNTNGESAFEGPGEGNEGANCGLITVACRRHLEFHRDRRTPSGTNGQRRRCSANCWPTTAYYKVPSFSNKIGMGDTVAVAPSGLTVSCQLRNRTRFRAGTGTCIDELGFHMMTPA